MNLTNISHKLLHNKWLMSRSGVCSLYSDVNKLWDVRVGGVWGMIAGTPAPALDDESESPEAAEGEVAIINISGVLVKGCSELEEQLLGLTNIDNISNALDAASQDAMTTSIILNFNSPGGETTGIEELARKVKYIDENVKPIYGWTETQACSAAYWLLSQTRKIGMTPSSRVGSCGVYVLVMDETERMRQEGIKIDPIYSGENKLIGHGFYAHSPEQRKILQDDVDEQHAKFKSVILAKRPNVPAEALEGLSYEGDKALSYSLVDTVKDDLMSFLEETPN